MKNKSLSNAYLSALCLELAMLLQAGIAIGDGILMLQDDETDKASKAVLQGLLSTVEKGRPLSEALRESGYFPRYMVNMTEIGERTGRTADTLKALSEYYDRQERLSASIRSAVLYPLILLALMVAVVLILIIKVLPMFNEVFNSLGAQMSSFAVTLMSFGGWLKSAAVVIAIIIGVILLLALAAWLIPGVRGGISSALKNKWGNSGIFGKIASSRFTSAMALAIAGGLDIEEAIEMAATISGGSKAVDEKHKECVNLLRSGSTLADALSKTGILSARNSRLLSLGSRSGAEDAAMSEIASRSGRNVQEEIDGIVSRVEPALVIITSVIIGVILLSVMLPLMGIMTSIG